MGQRERLERLEREAEKIVPQTTHELRWIFDRIMGDPVAYGLAQRMVDRIEKMAGGDHSEEQAKAILREDRAARELAARFFERIGDRPGKAG